MAGVERGKGHKDFQLLLMFYFLGWVPCVQMFILLFMRIDTLLYTYTIHFRIQKCFEKFKKDIARARGR